MTQIPAEWKQCATCAYWMGARQTDNFGQKVFVGSSTDTGKCACRGNGWTNSSRQAGATCSSFVKWAPLK